MGTDVLFLKYKMLQLNQPQVLICFVSYFLRDWTISIVNTYPGGESKMFLSSIE